MLAFENNEIEDYVTEKLINAYQAGTVPVYMGSPNSKNYLLLLSLFCFVLINIHPFLLQLTNGKLQTTH